ncbi:MAG: J domain-containing protein [Treponema sp.]|nr:J domain-containing protein [Treponema sp.]
MNGYYELLGVNRDASLNEIKKAFRKKAKRLHPDIAGKDAEKMMRRLLIAYKTLSSEQRRFEYDKMYAHFAYKNGFNYREWLREQEDDPVSQAKLIFYELLHLEEDEAIAIWRKNGGIGFPIEQYLGRGDWMDCCFFLAEELDRRLHCFEAIMLLIKIMREERRKPYFRLFAPEIEKFIIEIAQQRLRKQVDDEIWNKCKEQLQDLGVLGEKID